MGAAGGLLVSCTYRHVVKGITEQSPRGLHSSPTLPDRGLLRGAGSRALGRAWLRAQEGELPLAGLCRASQDLPHQPACTAPWASLACPH